jgi:hypothetical protein
MAGLFGTGTFQGLIEATETWPVLQEQLIKLNDNLEVIRTNALNDTSRACTSVSPDTSQTLSVASNGWQEAGVISAASPGALTITLPASANLTVGYKVKIFDRSGNCNSYNITIARNTGQTINGAASNLTLSFNFGHYELKYVATDTWIITAKLLA